MEATELFRGRLIDHLQLVVRDLDASRRFYEPVLATLGIPLGGSAQGAPTGRHHFAFQARDQAMVDAFHAAAVANGGRDNGPPGERPYHPGYYAAFVLDPDGNNIEAVYHGPAQRSADAVRISFEG